MDIFTTFYLPPVMFQNCAMDPSLHILKHVQVTKLFKRVNINKLCLYIYFIYISLNQPTLTIFRKCAYGCQNNIIATY